MRSDYVNGLDRLVASGAAANRSELVDKVVGGFLADLRHQSNPQQSQQSALGNFIAFLLIVVGLTAILKALGDRD